ncbi:hypothetical protein RB195_015030 [Necator americanus]|uniref:Uncharacterized protein n=1 Tax=Necator americanus TaxID=51031 RepID=A0ABR1E2M6_NECAM
MSEVPQGELQRGHKMPKEKRVMLLLSRMFPSRSCMSHAGTNERSPGPGGRIAPERRGRMNKISRRRRKLERFESPRDRTSHDVLEDFKGRSVL